MSNEDEKLKLHIHYGDLISKEVDNVCYKGGSTAPYMLVDPDLLTFSIFEDFSRNGEVVCDVEKLWYRLPNEDMSRARSIWEDKDREIIKMASEAKDCGEVNIYVEYKVTPPTVLVEGEGLLTTVGRTNGNEECLDDGEDVDDENGSDEEDRVEEIDDSDGENRDDESEEEERQEEDGEQETRQEDGGVQSEDVNQILGEGSVDPRFENLFALGEQEPSAVRGKSTQPNVDGDVANSDVEGDRKPPPDEYPESPEDIDEEWANWEKKDERGRRFKGKSKAHYDQPPYLWLMQTFKNGYEFKDQLLMNVLKTQFDVKLSKWNCKRYAAICAHEKCKWRIYCSVEKPIRKWMVKVYEEKHNYLPTGRAQMLKHGTIAKLYKEEARRRPDVRSSDIKNDSMHTFKISVSIFKCRKSRRITLDMVLETQSV